jgi:hypothetical protein
MCKKYLKGSEQCAIRLTKPIKKPYSHSIVDGGLEEIS